MKRKRYATMYQKRGRWYADFRGYADCGGEREALIPDGARHATTDQAQAALLFAKRLQELLDIREGRLVRDDREPVPTLREYVPRHLKRKAASVAPRTLKEDTARLDALLPEWGDLRLSQITTRRINDLILERQSAGFAPQTVNHVVSALSSLLRHAVSDGYLPINPAHGVERPRITRPPAQWLESAEGHRLLVAAAELDADVNFHGVHCLEALIGSALLTGGRRDELLALLVEDVDFDAGLVHFRPNEYYPRRKSRHATRAVPLWPQLRRILVAHVGDRRKGLLFPGAQGHPLHDARGSLDAAFAKAELQRPAGKAWHLFRHTYTAMRLQTLDHGAPVSLWTVKEELGHGSVTLIEQTYGHLLKERRGQRLSIVDYRPMKIAQQARAV